MRRIAYSQEEFPPFPAVWVELHYLIEAKRSVLAKLDSGAARTVAPVPLLDEVGAVRQWRTALCRACDGERREWPVFEVDLTIVDPRWPDDVQRKFQRLLVLGVDGPAEVLIGRDVLAAWQLHLDGPQSRYSVE